MARDNIAKMRRPGPDASPAARSVRRITASLERTVDMAERTLHEIDAILRTEGRAAIDAELGADAPRLIQAWQRLRQFVTAFDGEADVPPNPHAGGPTPREGVWQRPSDREEPVSRRGPRG